MKFIRFELDDKQQMNKRKMCLVVESYGCYNVSEGTYGFVRYICGKNCLQFESMTSDDVLI